MDKDNLVKANAINKEVEELEKFIHVAEMVWTGQLISGSYGTYQKKTFNMNTKIKNRVLEVLVDYKKELQDELNQL